MQNQPRAGIAFRAFFLVMCLVIGTQAVPSLRGWSSPRAASAAAPYAFLDPTGVTVDRAGNIFVADAGHNRVVKLNRLGQLITAWPVAFHYSESISGLQHLARMATDGAGNVYLAILPQRRVLKFSPTGKPLGQWSTGKETAVGVEVDAHGIVNVLGSDGTLYRLTVGLRNIGIWHVNGYADDLAAGPAGAVYIAWTNADTECDDQGRCIDHPYFLVDRYASAKTHRTIRRYQSGAFSQALTVAADPQRGIIYVSATGCGDETSGYPANQIERRLPNGTWAAFGSRGNRPGQFDNPSDMAVDSQGNLYVADAWNDRVQKLSPQGKPLAQWGGSQHHAPALCG